MSDISDLSMSSTIQKCQDPIQASLDDSIVLMDIESGLYIEFDMIAADIWERIVGTVRVCDLITDLSTIYSGEQAELQADVLEFLSFLIKNGMLSIVDTQR